MDPRVLARLAYRRRATSASGSGADTVAGRSSADGGGDSEGDDAGGAVRCFLCNHGGHSNSLRRAYRYHAAGILGAPRHSLPLPEKHLKRPHMCLLAQWGAACPPGADEAPRRGLEGNHQRQMLGEGLSRTGTKSSRIEPPPTSDHIGDGCGESKLCPE